MTDPGAALSWTDWPASRARGRAAAATAVIAVTVVVVATLDPWLAVLGGAALLASTAEALLPLRYTLSDDGVELRGWFTARRVAWADLASWSRAPDGFVLQGRGRSPFLRRRRSVRLRCPGRESAVSSYLAAALPQPAGAP